MSTAPVAIQVGGSIPAKKRKVLESEDDVTAGAPSRMKKKASLHDPRTKAARARRLAQNRQAAKESRKRKKSMIEELQRSVVFFGKANAILRNEHQELTLKLLTAHAELSKLGLPIPEQRPGDKRTITSAPTPVVAVNSEPTPAAVSSIDATRPTDDALPSSVETGATMQGMFLLLFVD
jgi:hypothetical protein